MIDIHSHLLPGIDDGAHDLDCALQMAEIAWNDGTTVIACTPHIWPPTYPNTADDIRRRVADLQAKIAERGIDLKLVVGADIHIASDLLRSLSNGAVPTLADTKYFLLEPEHHVLTPNLVRFCQSLIDKGYMPILTHPERLGWIEGHFKTIHSLFEAGVVIQVTADSLTGGFGTRVQHWTRQMLALEMIDVVASDAHGVSRRSPVMSKARALVAKTAGERTAERLFRFNPGRILMDQPIERSAVRSNLDNVA